MRSERGIRGWKTSVRGREVGERGRIEDYTIITCGYTACTSGSRLMSSSCACEKLSYDAVPAHRSRATFTCSR